MFRNKDILDEKLVPSEFELLLEHSNFEIFHKDESKIFGKDNIIRLLDNSINQLIDETAFEIISKSNLSVAFDEDKCKVLKKLSSFFETQDLGNSEYYFRAGKNYFIINHHLGKHGSLLFKSLLNQIFKSWGRMNWHINETKTSLSVIFR